MNNFDTELLLLEIEDLFQRFRNLPVNTRAVILEKIRVKLLEEFNDFIIQENDGTQETVIEIPFDNNAEDSIKPLNSNEIHSADDYYSAIPVVTSRANDFFTTNSLDLKAVPRSRTIQSKKIRFVCNYCGRQYRRKRMFDLHIDGHENEQMYECADCSNQFRFKEDLIKHMKLHAKRRYFSCPICFKRLVNNRTLRNHIRVIHRKKEKFTCNKCDYFAYSRHTLKEHNKTKHEKLFTKYACVICNNVYNSRVLLKVHLRSHTGEKPYKCKECDAAFVSSGQLTNHQNSVHGEFKYACEMCPKLFKTIHRLRRHSYIHTRVKPFACPFCTNYASNTQSNLTKHVKTVHQMNDFSYLKYKKMMLGELEEVQEEWRLNAESFTKEYLQRLASDGNVLSIDKLKELHSRTNSKIPSKQNDAFSFNDLIEVGNSTLNSETFFV